MEKEQEWLLSEKYQGEKTSGFFADCARLKHGEPLAYLIGYVPFLNTTIHLDSHPLIPRVETEHWVHEAIKKILRYAEMTKKEPHVLDLCAGSGCIGIAVLKHIKNSKVDFAEINSRHHDVIRKNLKENALLDRETGVLGGDLYENIRDSYDFILSNPPYIDAKLNRTQKSVSSFEPPEALYGGAGGLTHISRILKEATQYLTEKGMLYLEHEPEQEAHIRSMAAHNAMRARFFPDQFGIIRYTRLERI